MRPAFRANSTQLSWFSVPETQARSVAMEFKAKSQSGIVEGQIATNDERYYYCPVCQGRYERSSSFASHLFVYGAEALSVLHLQLTSPLSRIFTAIGLIARALSQSINTPSFLVRVGGAIRCLHLGRHVENTGTGWRVLIAAKNAKRRRRRCGSPLLNDSHGF